MEFSDKLNFLFELTHAEGQELAAAMNVTPPQISKMRNGSRPLPRSREAAATLAGFFALRCASDVQRDALSKAIRVSQIRSITNVDTLTDILLDWLSDDRDPDEYAARSADVFLRRFGSLYGITELPTQDSTAGNALVGGKSSFFAYYGSEGKRVAVQTFLGYIAQRKLACTVNTLTDESVAWITEDANYSGKITASMMKLIDQGCTFRRIAGPILDMDQAFESLMRWFPLYMTGKATSYYYKRLRDGLNRITLFIVPEVAVLFSFSVNGMPPESAVTFFTMDEKTVASMMTVYESYLAQCEPILNVYSMLHSSKRMHRCMLDYESRETSCIQRSNSLSFITLPWDVARTLSTGLHADKQTEFLTSFAQRYKKFRANLANNMFVDIVRLADIDDIVDGKAAIPGAAVLSGKPRFYTAADYMQHVAGVLYLLEHSPNYHVVLRRPKDDDPTIIYVKESCCAILTRDAAPYSVFEVSERYLVDAFAEYLRRLIPAKDGGSLHKKAVAAELRALMKQLELRMSYKRG